MAVASSRTRASVRASRTGGGSSNRRHIVANQLGNSIGTVFVAIDEICAANQSTVKQERTSPQEAPAPRSACVALDAKERVIH